MKCKMGNDFKNGLYPDKPVEKTDKVKVLDILRRNKGKLFVKRVLEPEKYPSLDLGNGMRATHKMAWGETNDEKGNKVYRVHPTVLLNKEGKLEDLGDKSYARVIETGDYIDFSTPEEADWFSKRYKSVWDK